MSTARIHPILWVTLQRICNEKAKHICLEANVAMFVSIYKIRNIYWIESRFKTTTLRNTSVLTHSKQTSLIVFTNNMICVTKLQHHLTSTFLLILQWTTEHLRLGAEKETKKIWHNNWARKGEHPQCYRVNNEAQLWV